MVKRATTEVVMVTGAGAGLGRAIVQAFARRGASIGLLSRGRERLEDAKHGVERLGSRALILPTDVADADAVDAAASSSSTTRASSGSSGRSTGTSSRMMPLLVTGFRFTGAGRAR